MTKISCLGDSIRLQYVPRVRELLGEDFEIYAPEGNCRFAKYTLRGLFEWEKDMKGSRIVHWNNGLWDVCDLFGDGAFTSEQEYCDNMLRIADILLKRYGTVIFATTTPVSKDNQYNDNKTIKRYNDILVPLLRKRGILINDLYSAVSEDIDRYIYDDTIHLSVEGIELCAKMTADAIRTAAENLSDIVGDSDSEAPRKEKGAPVIFGE